MKRIHITASLAAMSLMIVAAPGFAQDQGAAPAADAPAADSQAGQDLPEVKVIQEQPKPQPVQQAAPKPKPKKVAAKPRPAPAPQPAPVQQFEAVEDDFGAPAEISEPAQVMANSPYGASAGAGAAQRAEFGNIAPINARTMLPGDLQNYTGAGSRVTTTDLDEQRPQTNHEALSRVPGVVTVNDDGVGRHGGIGIRGSAPRRSRKVLVMEDGQPINFSPYLDSSTHYTPPTERLESIEVTRGYVVNYGPLNNHGVVNFRNLSPFGANETVLKFGIGHTWDVDKDWNNFRHVHTRQSAGNWGVVASYSGSETGGAWDNEVLRYNDFYGAIGVKGDNQDLTVSGGFFRQRDDYDEDNFLRGDFSQFIANGRRKGGDACLGQPNPSNFEATCGHDASTYNGDHYRLQVAHNYYFDKNTTVSTRLYGADHDRARFYPDQTGEFVPDGVDPDLGVLDDPQTGPLDLVMAGRDRRYQNYGVDSRIEMANLPFFGGMTHDLQVGARYERGKFRNRNREGEAGEILSFGNRGELDEQQNLESDSFAAFIQTAIHVTNTLTVTPGLRFEDYDTSFRAVVGDGVEFGELKSSHTEVLPGIAFAWEVAPRSTIYGSYHRGLTPHLVRDALEDFDPDVAPYNIDDEIGNNFQIGYRTTAVRGITFDASVFHNRIDNYQFGEAFQSDTGDRVFSAIDKVEFTGFEVGSRIDSHPFVGGPWNVFAEAVYTYTDSDIKANAGNPGTVGNEVPEAIKHYANLTLGVAYKKLWNASITATHRGGWFIDDENTKAFDFSGPACEDGDCEGGEIEPGRVDGQWLLSARANYNVSDKLTLWATGQNLTNEFYLAGVEDGVKPSIARSVMGGFTIKFD